MTHRLLKQNKIFMRLFAVVLAVFVFTGLFVGALESHSSESIVVIEQDMEAGSGDCPFSPGSSLCDMTLTAHLDAWRFVLTGLLPSIELFALLGLLFVSFRYGGNGEGRETAKLSRIRPWVSPFFHFIQRKPLQNFFSQGILNSKAY